MDNILNDISPYIEDSKSVPHYGNYKFSCNYFNCIYKNNLVYNFCIHNDFINIINKKIDIISDKDNYILNKISSSLKNNYIIKDFILIPDFEIKNITTYAGAYSPFKDFFDYFNTRHFLDKHKYTFSYQKQFQLGHDSKLHPVIIFDINIPPLNYRMYISVESEKVVLLPIPEDLPSYINKMSLMFFEDFFIDSNDIKIINTFISESWKFDIMYNYINAITKDHKLTYDLLKHKNDSSELMLLLDMIQI